MRPAATRKSDRRRAEILAAAVGHFNRAGLNGATLSGIAASVGMVTNGVAYYFRRKEDLAAACLICSLQDLRAAIDAPLREADPQIRLQKLCVAWFERIAAGLEGRDREIMVFNDIRAIGAPQGEEVYRHYNDFFRSLRQVFEGTAPGTDSLCRNARTHLLLSTLHAAQEWFPVHYDPCDHAHVASRVAQILGAGLGGDQPEQGAALSGPDRHTDEIRSAYLRVATRLINQHGYPGASVERIAGELNLTKGSFYHHIDAKDDLVAACFERTFAVLREGQDRGFAADGTGARRLAVTVGALLGWQLSDAGPMLRISAYNSLPETLRPRIRLAAERLVARFAWQIGEAQGDGSMPVRDPVIAARMLDAMLNAAIELEWWVPEPQRDGALPHYIDGLTRGLFAPPRQ